MPRSCEANTRLIAAAPDLLAAAKKAYEFSPFHSSDCERRINAGEGEIFDSTEGCTCFIGELLAAIDKAEGRES